VRNLLSPCLRIIPAAGVMCALAALAASAANAHGTRWPHHQYGPRYCIDGEIEIYPPTQMLSAFEVTDPLNSEAVWWSPDLLRYNRRQGRWELVRRGGSYIARVTSAGLLQDAGTVWTDEVDGVPISSASMRIRRAGRYRVRHYFQWEQIDAGHLQRGNTCRYP
jgi:hypothetical protein